MPVSIARLRELIELAGADGVESIDVVEGGTRIRIARRDLVPARAAVQQRLAPTVSPKADRADFLAPMFGVLHLTPAPDAPPYVRIGDRVKAGQQLCLIEAMKMFNPVLCDRDGRVDAVLAEAGEEIANGQPLFRIVDA